jgi:hypothetical protein
MRCNVVGFVFAAFAALAVLPGCSGELKRSRVHGKITYLGAPVPGCTVIFMSSDNMTHIADLQPDGSYSVTGIPRGKVRVSIQQPPPRPASKSEFAPQGGFKKDPEGKGANPPPAAEAKLSGVRIPVSYADPNQSGLEFDLKEPEHEFSIDLK